MRLKDILTGRYLNKTVLNPIRQRTSPPLKHQREIYSLDKNIELLKKIVNSNTSIFPESQMKEFKNELQSYIEKRKALA